MLTRNANGIEYNPEQCTQCGGCLAACATNSLQALPVDHGLFRIAWQEQKCTHCQKCIRTCSAHRLPTEEFVPDKLSSALDLFLGSAQDQKIRRSASSGGVGRLLIKRSLANGIADLAYTLKRTPDYPWAEGSFWEKGDDINAMPNSMYLPILVMKNLRLTERRKSMVVMGTACQLAAAEALIGNKVDRLFKVAIYCKQQKDFRATQYYAKRLKVKTGKGAPGRIREVEYRGEGWPGRVMVNQYSIAWEQAAGVPFGKRLWRVPGCRFCAHPYGLNADLTLLDPWGIRRENPLGETLIVIWTKEGRELLDNAAEELRIEPISPQEGKRAVNHGDMLRKAMLVNYYLGRSVAFRNRLAGLGEQLQALVYETLLAHFDLPPIAHKLIAHAPDLRDIFIPVTHDTNNSSSGISPCLSTKKK